MTPSEDPLPSGYSSLPGKGSGTDSAGMPVSAANLPQLRFPQPKFISGSLADALGHYVYLLIDPRDGQVFYVGKGIGGRCFDHDSREDGERKAARMAEIEAAGLETSIDIIRHGMATKEEAFLVESAVIDVYGIANLTNRVKGHGSTDFGRASLANLAARYAPEEAEILHRVVFVKLADTFRKGMSADALYEAARGVWNLSVEYAQDYGYVLALWEGLVVEVYHVVRWQPANPAHYPTRFGKDLLPAHFIPRTGVQCTEFEGVVAAEEIRKHYLGKSVRKQFDVGGQANCKYGPDV